MYGPLVPPGGTPESEAPLKNLSMTRCVRITALDLIVVGHVHVHVAYGGEVHRE